MIRKPLTLVVVAVFGFALSADSPTVMRGQNPPASPATSTASKVGTVVGTGVNAMLAAAFPAAATIINAIWGQKPNQNMKANQAQTPVNQLQQTTAANIQKLSSDLDTVNIFLVDCVMADRSVIHMLDTLAKKATISDADKQTLTADWNSASPRIEELGKDTAKASANAVSDEYIKRSLLAISETNYGGLTNIKDDITNKNAGDLRDRLTSLEPKLSAVTALSGDIIGQVSSGLHAGAKNMTPSQGVEDEREKAFIRRFEDSQNIYETILQKEYGVTPRTKP